MQDVQGKAVFEQQFTEVLGSPYLYQEWTRGQVELITGQLYKDLALKYNSFSDEVYYKDPTTGTTMNFISPVKMFKLDKNGEREIYFNGFPDINNFSNKTYYQVLADGETKLLFKRYKYLVESKEFNSATTTRSFSESSAYYLFKNGTLERIKPSRKEFLDLFKDKEEQIKAYQKKESIDYKNDSDLGKLVLYYNSL